MKVTLMEKIIYMDNAATTSVSKAAFNAMVPFYETHFGNPSSIYSIGQTAKNAIEDARKTVAYAWVQKSMKFSLLLVEVNQTTGLLKALLMLC